jgi:hypothetical protein
VSGPEGRESGVQASRCKPSGTSMGGTSLVAPTSNRYAGPLLQTPTVLNCIQYGGSDLQSSPISRTRDRCLRSISGSHRPRPKTSPAKFREKDCARQIPGRGSEPRGRRDRARAHGVRIVGRHAALSEFLEPNLRGSGRRAWTYGAAVFVVRCFSRAAFESLWHAQYSTALHRV